MQLHGARWIFLTCKAKATGPGHTATLLLEVNAKQIGQLCRDWHAIVDVTDVSVSEAPEDLTELKDGLDFDDNLSGTVVGHSKRGGSKSVSLAPFDIQIFLSS